ncbi:AI-2E family transporter [Psychroserpens jangbogonensis]|uniref:AI-2E family transporter n=1 Tax=Psychroserpens jangbogonensis TaxID=1484460 RepID=UPI00053E9E9D|nr:AI-2E family transporter [Psychroserpens jangbogonensis]
MNKNISITEILKIIVLLLMVTWCFFIVRPFLLAILWAIILAVALYPLFEKWMKKFGKNRKTGVSLFTLFGSIILFIPLYFMIGSIVENTKVTINQIQNHSLQIPQPEDSIKDWPLIGEPLYKEWDDLATNAREYAVLHEDLILEKGSGLITNIGGFIGSLITFIISFLIAVLFMYHSDSGYKISKQLMQKLLGDQSEEIINMSRDTIRSVVKGILLVALIQAFLAFIGFKAIGLPAAGIFALVVLITAIVQIPAILTMIPAIIIAFSTSDPTPAIIFAIYCVLVGLADNVLKPLLLGKGLQTPMIIILIGTIGGMLLHGIIGLFVGAIVLAVMHRIYIYWVTSPDKKINL